MYFLKREFTILPLQMTRNLKSPGTDWNGLKVEQIWSQNQSNHAKLSQKTHTISIEPIETLSIM